MAVRWTAVVFRETEEHHCRILDCQHLWILKAHLDERATERLPRPERSGNVASLAADFNCRRDTLFVGGAVKKLLIAFTLIAVPSAAQDVRPPLSEQAVEAANLRVQVERWDKIADRSMHTWGLLSAASLAVTGLEDQHPRRTNTINIIWAGNGVVWMVAHLRARHLRSRLEAIGKPGQIDDP